MRKAKKDETNSKEIFCSCNSYLIKTTLATSLTLIFIIFCIILKVFESKSQFSVKQNECLFEIRL